MRLTRRGLLLGSAAALGCRKHRGSGYPGYAFVANQEGRSVSAVDLTEFRVARHIMLSGNPSAVIAHPTLPMAYVLTPQTGFIHEIAASTLAVSRRRQVAASAVSMRMAPSDHALWVLCREPQSLVRIALDRLEPGVRIGLHGSGEDFDLFEDAYEKRRLAAVSLPEERSVVIANLDTREVRRLTDIAPRVIRFRFDGRQFIVGSRVGRVLNIVDVANGRSVVQLPLPIEPAHFCFKSDGGQLFVTGPGMDAVVVVYPYQTEVAETVLAGRTPGAMAVSSAPEYLFVANPQSGDMTVVDINSRRVIAAVAVGREPGQILITPDNQYALVLNERSSDIAVIRLAALAATRRKTDGPTPLFTMIAVGEKPVSAAVVPS